MNAEYSPYNNLGGTNFASNYHAENDTKNNTEIDIENNTEIDIENDNHQSLPVIIIALFQLCMYIIFIALDLAGEYNFDILVRIAIWCLLTFDIAMLMLYVYAYYDRCGANDIYICHTLLLLIILIINNVTEAEKNKTFVAYLIISLMPIFVMSCVMLKCECLSFNR